MFASNEIKEAKDVVEVVFSKYGRGMIEMSDASTRVFCIFRNACFHSLLFKGPEQAKQHNYDLI